MKRLTIMLLMLLLVALVSAATSTSALRTKMETAYDKINTFQAAVTQSNYYPQLKKTITYNGNIWFTPGRMVMHFTTPSVQRLQIQNGKVDLYDAMSKTVFRSEMLPEFGKMNPVEILQVYWAKSSVSVVSEDTSNATVKLVPTKDDMVSALTATLNKSSGMVSKLSYTDISGNSVTYSFSGIKLNGGIAASVWNFTYPKGVQIVEQ